MTPAIARRLAWTLSGSALGLMVLTAVLDSLWPTQVIGGEGFLYVLAIVSFSIVGGYVASRRPENPIGWIMCVAGLAVSISGIFDTYSRYVLLHGHEDLPGGPLAGWISNVTGSLFFFLALTYVLQLFPTGKVLAPRWRFLLWGTSVSLIVLIFGIGLAPGPIEDLPFVDNPFGLSGTWGAFSEAAAGIGWLLTMACLLLSVASIVLRWRRSRGDERQQLKWLATAGVTLLLAMAAAVPTNRWEILIVPLAGVPIAAGIAILKYRLYDIDVVINKTIVFGVLAAFITGIYVAIVVGIGTLLGSQDEPNLALSIAATAIVAIAFSPVKERTQRIANRVVYGYRLSPYEVLAELSRTVATAPTPEDVLTEVAHAAAIGISAESATVTLSLHEGAAVKKTWPEDAPDRPDGALLDVTHRGEPLGTMRVSKRAGDPITPQDAKLLQDLAAQAGLALHNARLALELRARLDEISAQAQELEASRNRIVTAADDSRRRLEKDISQGPRRDLLNLHRGLKQAEDMFGQDPEATAVELESLTRDATETLDALRELARGIYPPLLADKGVVAALGAHIRKHELPVVLRADGLGNQRLDESIENAVYFCSVEALRDASRDQVLSLRRTRTELTVQLGPTEIGVDALEAMDDRVEALGGNLTATESGEGRRIVLSLPISLGAPPEPRLVSA
jgi:signal transduction histidine kinase